MTFLKVVKHAFGYTNKSVNDKLLEWNWQLAKFYFLSSAFLSGQQVVYASLKCFTAEINEINNYKIFY